ncbi:hypothetical protein A9G34_05635 [Gilliamella sp. Choc4-2]|uniref:YhdT family protein n=1 Tax=unclassified Gilliamella TaxID=2685620 RepID=UPI00080DAB64|nr:DUF997 family protein [Gilliamella apicola]OCG33527.1 hypothetical protein A9G33_00785 [Gilliamella apicola]OCG46081.1 hypothetical protein A9G34_05635 [Gilliamella apicola]OCG54853.1 hypothetical protein A9G36_07200 [Gilliamella apicola]
MDTRYKQANKEAILSLLVTVIYLIAWVVTAYNIGNESGILGFPMWFELSCIMSPLSFILLCWGIVKFQFKNISLEQTK